jgi:hypothetical protein
MGSLETTTECVTRAIQEGSRGEGIEVTLHLEPYGNTDSVSLFVFGDAFKEQTPGNRHMRIMRWVREFAPEVQNRIATVLVLTSQEAGRVEQQTPSSGSILDLGQASGF